MQHSTSEGTTGNKGSVNQRIKGVNMHWCKCAPVLIQQNDGTGGKWKEGEEMGLVKEDNKGSLSLGRTAHGNFK